MMCEFLIILKEYFMQKFNEVITQQISILELFKG